MYDVNHWPDCCPFGHQLGPGRGSMSWDMGRKKHWLFCRVGGCRSRLLLGEPGAQWEMYAVMRREWITVE